jgi:hypothetical protein
MFLEPIPQLDVALIEPGTQIWVQGKSEQSGPKECAT